MDATYIGVMILFLQLAVSIGLSDIARAIRESK